MPQWPFKFYEQPLLINCQNPYHFGHRYSMFLQVCVCSQSGIPQSLDPVLSGGYPICWSTWSYSGYHRPGQRCAWPKKGVPPRLGAPHSQDRVLTGHHMGTFSKNRGTLEGQDGCAIGRHASFVQAGGFSCCFLFTLFAGKLRNLVWSC